MEETCRTVAIGPNHLSVDSDKLPGFRKMIAKDHGIEGEWLIRNTIDHLRRRYVQQAILCHIHQYFGERNFRSSGRHWTTNIQRSSLSSRSFRYCSSSTAAIPKTLSSGVRISDPKFDANMFRFNRQTTIKKQVWTVRFSTTHPACISTTARFLAPRTL